MEPHVCSPPFVLVTSVERALGQLIAYASAFFFSLGHVVMLELDYWENCGSLRRKGKWILVMLVHCSFSYIIVSLCTCMFTCSAGRCWFVLFYFAVRQLKDLDFHREA